jgi:general secretion pathway protein A
MFIQHFALNEEAFGVTPDPKFLYFGREHREAMSSLYHGIVNSRGFTVMIAPPGMGKTTLLRYLLGKIEDWADTAFLFCSFDDKNDLLQAVMTALSVEPDGSAYFPNWRRLQADLQRRSERGRKIVLVFDEAQNLSSTTLEDIRMFSNLETTQTKLVQIVLAGQPALLQKLQAPELEQLGQRIGVYGRILPLDATEVEAYLNHRLGVAGRTERLFTPEAVSLIAQCSGGVPRSINTICYNAMALGWVLGRQMIDEELVEQASRDVKVIESKQDPIARRSSGNGNDSNGHTEPPAAQGNLPGQLVEILWNLGELLEELEKLSRKTKNTWKPRQSERDDAEDVGEGRRPFRSPRAGANRRSFPRPGIAGESTPLAASELDETAVTPPVPESPAASPAHESAPEPPSAGAGRRAEIL